jgi:hypothetical protein
LAAAEAALHARAACTAAEAALHACAACSAATAAAAAVTLSLRECDTAGEGEREDSNCQFVHRFVPFKLLLVGMVFGTPLRMSSINPLRTPFLRRIYMKNAFF